jgi:hypothetical protein
VQNLRDIKVWQKGHHLTLDVYKLTNTYPKSELFALTSQMRRAAMSVPANVKVVCKVVMLVLLDFSITLWVQHQNSSITLNSLKIWSLSSQIHMKFLTKK